MSNDSNDNSDSNDIDVMMVMIVNPFTTSQNRNHAGRQDRSSLRGRLFQAKSERFINKREPL